MLQGNNPANDPDRKPVKGRSKFKPNRSLYHTPVFGLNTPHFAMEAIEGDRVSVRVQSDVDTFNLQAPMMSPVKMHKDYFFASLRSVLPLNADKVITNPLSGDDIVAEDVNTVVSLERIQTYVRYCIYWMNDALNKAAGASSLKAADSYLLALLTFIVRFVEPIFSDGSLLSHLGCNLGSVLSFYNRSDGSLVTLDEFVEILTQRLVRDLEYVSVVTSYQQDAGQYNPVMNRDSFELYPGMSSVRNSYSRANMRRFLEEVRQGVLPSEVLFDNIVLNADADTNQRGLLIDTGDPTSIPFINSWLAPSEKFLNYGRCVAYQLSSAQFYTDDAVDFVYDAHTWHDNMNSIYVRALNGNNVGSPLRYRWNGIYCDYDSVSGAVVDEVLNLMSNIGTYNGFATSIVDAGGSDIGVDFFGTYTFGVQIYYFAAYIVNLFGFTRSLKFRDYFVGSKPHPLAVGDVNVQVAAGEFSVVDVTKKIQFQRFFNQVNRIGRRLTQYVEGIFGVTPAHDPRDVVFLGTASDVIGAEETDNTGSAQLSEPQTTTSKLRMDSSRFAFEGSFAEPGYMIGITRFDVVRPYLNGADRSFFHVDRFDMFNPYLQQIGDQSVFGQELTFAQDTDFAYQLRYMEYRQSVDRAAGGFRSFLPGYAFLNDDFATRSIFSPSLEISPDFIRSRPSEFDRFYVSLTHYSLAGYFHFIVRNDIAVDADRPMEAAPSIL